MKKYIIYSICTLFSTSGFSGTVTYNGFYSANLSRNYAEVKYVPNWETSNIKKHRYKNPFNDYHHSSLGGNCTNFASQSLLAGLTKSNTIWETFNRRQQYNKDTSWFFISDKKRGSAWTGANQMYKYANKGNKKKGILFRRKIVVTNQNKDQEWTLWSVKKGDLMSADWDGDGKIDHSGIVTFKRNYRPYYKPGKYWWQHTTYVPGGSSVNVTYQNGDYVVDGRTVEGRIRVNKDIKKLFIGKNKDKTKLYFFRPKKYKN